MRISPQRRQATEQRIRHAIQTLLRGEIPPGGRCDLTTLARQAGVDRTAFYGTRPYAHLREEFEQQLKAQQRDDEHPDPRDAQVHRLKTTIGTLHQRIACHEQSTAKLTQLNQQALSRLAAQHEEITRLRAALERASNIRRLPTAPT